MGSGWPDRTANYRRAQVLLAMKDPDTIVSNVCQQTGMTRMGIWHLCRRYESVGLDAIYNAPRSASLGIWHCSVWALNNWPVASRAVSDWE